MKVGISKCRSKFDKYLDWLEFFGIEYEVLDYENGKGELDKIHNCSALILSGGTDIYPEIYCDWDTTETKGTYEPERDGFEMNLIEAAIVKKMPILAICRGSQLINVYFRGNLIFDIEEIRGFSYRKMIKDGVYPEIDINIFRNSLAYEIFESETIRVVVSNNQAVERVGEGLMINSKSQEGIIMGTEYANKEGKGFLLGIQWHPERYTDYSAEPSVKLANRLKKEIEIYTS
ncbi:MAG: gamma-glutamyl-gamma-aminobutyrate hydrolase family protein [Ignavibacteriae bacterium]|nr:gamma-glutamyl-gamma-aminobutyrate hydrolase family protein [Ignavibacteriota bacterium]MCB9243426.1 gamma-glutamyl-gamma-aminobutyrate hydrolase family protein [Ignavibacteriales bacterium]